MTAPTHIVNARVVSPGTELEQATIVLENGLIQSVADASTPERGASAVVWDAQGSTVVPGFIDIHTHGAAGHDFCDLNPESLAAIGEAKIREGVTTFLPTTLTLPPAELTQAFRLGEPYCKNPTGAKVAGIHVEGPFINPDCTGAQNPDYVRPPDWNELRALNEILPIRIVSLAVEMPGGLELVQTLTQAGITSSLAHTAATYEQFQAARAAGATHLTHFCNQMTRLHHREIGLVGAGLLDDAVRVEIICDRIHLCPEMIQLAFKIIGPERLMLITDSMAASGLADNQRTQLGGLEVIVQDGVARLPSGALAGSTLTMDRALQNVRELTGLPLSDLIQTTALNQAESLGLKNLGRIAPGYRADLVVLDAAGKPQAVFVEGQEKLHPLT